MNENVLIKIKTNFEVKINVYIQIPKGRGN